VDSVDAQAKDLVDNSHPSTDQILARQDELHAALERLQKLLDVKREELQAASGLCNFHIDVNETMVRCSTLQFSLSVILMTLGLLGL